MSYDIRFFANRERSPSPKSLYTRRTRTKSPPKLRYISPRRKSPKRRNTSPRRDPLLDPLTPENEYAKNAVLSCRDLKLYIKNMLSCKDLLYDGFEKYFWPQMGRYILVPGVGGQRDNKIDHVKRYYIKALDYIEQGIREKCIAINKKELGDANLPVEDVQEILMEVVIDSWNDVFIEKMDQNRKDRISPMFETLVIPEITEVYVKCMLTILSFCLRQLKR